MEHLERIAKSRACGFLEAAETTFRAKVSGTFNRYRFVFSLFRGRLMLSCPCFLPRVRNFPRRLTPMSQLRATVSGTFTR